MCVESAVCSWVIEMQGFPYSRSSMYVLMFSREDFLSLVLDSSFWLVHVSISVAAIKLGSFGLVDGAMWICCDQSIRGSISGLLSLLILGRAWSRPCWASSLAMLSTYSFSGILE